MSLEKAGPCKGAAGREGKSTWKSGVQHLLVLFRAASMLRKLRGCGMQMMINGCRSTEAIATPTTQVLEVTNSQPAQ